LYFYELHEGDEDVFSDVLLVHDSEYDPEEFFELVQDIRRKVQDRFEHDTLIEAIAAELERHHGFVQVSDDRLTAAVNVSRDDDDNFLAEIDRDGGGGLDLDLDDEDADYISIPVEFDPGTRPN
jgi:hypothetical protein